MSKKDETKSGDKKVKKVTKAKKVEKTEEVAEVKETKSNKINDGKCCRCTSYTCEHKCRNKKSEKNGQYTPRKFGCKCFKYAE